MTIVVDASVAAKWILEEADSDRAESILSAVSDKRLAMLAPEILAAEIANVLWKAVWRDGMSVDDAEERYSAFLDVCPPLVRDSKLAAAALQLAVRFHWSVYDCLYIALAEQTPCELVTADEKLYYAVRHELGSVRLLGDSTAEQKL
jgi:predicted nucleic acid-binding protein